MLVKMPLNTLNYIDDCILKSLQSLALLVLTSAILGHAAIAQSVDIAPMTWTKRSDWLDVKSDPLLTVHAVGDGIVDDTAAIQEALDIVSASSEKSVVYLPEGTYRITDTLYWTTGQFCISGRSLYGCGKNTTIRWDGETDGIMFLSTGNAKSRYYGIRWDGNNTAATGMFFQPQFLFNPSQGFAEAPMLHYNQAFLNFTGVALDFRNRSHTEWTGEAEIKNTLFYNCQMGSQIGRDYYNNYEYIFESCHFEDCGTGIDSGKNSAQMVYNTRFIGSSVTDLTGEQNIRARHCISTGSKVFLRVPEYLGSGGRHAIQDCWIDSWTNTATGFNGGAIRIDKKAHAFVFDCKFTNPPNSQPPINMVNKSFDTPSNILVSNNYAPGFSTQASMVSTGTGGGTANVLPLSVAPSSDDIGITTILESPDYIFLSDDPIVDSTTILDVTKAPYNADNTNTLDASVAIQAAVNDAISANDGTIVYLPTGKYRIDSTISLTGGNYSVEGAGYNTQCIWNGSDAGIMFLVSTPQSIGLRHFQFKMPLGKIETVGIYVSATAPAKMEIREVYHRVYFGSNISSIGSAQPYPGIILDGLPEGSFVYLNTINTGGLTISGCGAAQILGQNGLPGKITIDGTASSSSGFLGFTYLNAMVIAGIAQIDPETDAFDIDIHDNQSFVVADYYNEQAYNNLYMAKGFGSGFGRVTFQGFRRESVNDNTAIFVDNYEGRLFYGLQLFENRDGATYMPSSIEHTGTNSFELVLVMNTFNYAAPSITLGQGATLISQFNKTITPPNAPPPVHALLQNTPAMMTVTEELSIRAGLDHLQELGLHQLKYHTGLEPVSKFAWVDTFSNISGTEALHFSGGTNDYRSGTLNPQGGIVDYTCWFSGGSTFDITFSSVLNAVNGEPGLVFENTTGAQISTNFAGFSSEDIDIANIMGWNPGQITMDQVRALTLYFDYSLDGFAHNMSVGLSCVDGSNVISCLGALGPSPTGKSEVLAMRNTNANNLQVMTNYLNNNGGKLKFTARMPSGTAQSGAKLALADLAITLPFSWYDDLSQTSGTGNDILFLQDSTGAYKSGYFYPQGTFHDYMMYYQGNTPYDWSLAATTNAINLSDGLILTNDSGATVNTSFGGFSVRSINVASVMGWEIGQISPEDVANLSLSFEYQISGFTNVFGIGFSTTSSSGSLLITNAFSTSGTATSATFSMGSVSQTQRQTFAEHLNNNGGFLNITALIPSGVATANAELRIANMVVYHEGQF